VYHVCERLVVVVALRKVDDVVFVLVLVENVVLVVIVVDVVLERLVDEVDVFE
jgi:hypothetical protein